MRTTVTLDADTEQILRSRMRERKVSFKQALNDAIREAQGRPTTPFRTRTIDMGRSSVDLDRALRLVGDLEDAEIIHKMRDGR